MAGGTGYVNAHGVISTILFFVYIHRYTSFFIFVTPSDPNKLT
jgi:hypothetical protein